MEWRAHDRCVIQDTANVLARYPELVGTIGDVLSVSSSASTPTVIEVKVCDGRVLKLKPSALQTLSGTARVAKLDQVEESDDDEAETKVSRARGSLKRGTSVTIQSTENNSQQRAAQLIGLVGVVKEVPQHPNTWYKVAFPGHRKIYTFRPSALRRVVTGPDAAAATSEQPGAAAPVAGGAVVAKSSSRNNAAKPKDEIMEDVALEVAPADVVKSRSAKVSSAKLLSNVVDADRWVGMHVRIRVGRLASTVGRILRSGNGWVQLRTARGEIAKRAYELELIGDTETPPDLRAADAAFAAKEAASLKKQSTTTVVAVPAPAPAPAPATNKTRQTRSGGNASPEASQDDGDTARSSSPVPFGQAPVVTTRSGAVGQPNVSPPPIAVVEAVVRPGLLSPSSRGFRGSEKTSTMAKQATYREGVRKHLERNRDKYKDRPNLAEWLHALQGGAWDPNASTGGAYLHCYPPEEEEEEELLLMGPRWKRRAEARKVQEQTALTRHGCPFCRVEKDGACWNPRCVLSPVFEGEEAPSSKKRPRETAKSSRRSSTLPNSLSRTPIDCEILSYCGLPETTRSSNYYAGLLLPTEAEEGEPEPYEHLPENETQIIAPQEPTTTATTVTTRAQWI